MKFGKSLSNQIEETLPEWRDKFLSYKELNKRLKMIEPKQHRAPKRRRLDEEGGDMEDMTAEEVNFVKILEAELEIFNAFFVEEEEYIIRLKSISCCIMGFIVQCQFKF